MERPSNDQLKSLNKDTLILLLNTIYDQNDAINSQLELYRNQLTAANKKLDLLTEQIALMNQRAFGRKSETAASMPGQLDLSMFIDVFNEAECCKDNSPEPTIEEVTISSYKRSKTKGQREINLDGLPSRVIPHKIPEAELKELFPNGYKELPFKTYKRLVIIPETFIVDEHQVHVYASKDNTGKIVSAPRPVDLFRNSIATPELVAAILNSKYEMHNPIERLSNSFKQNGINLESNTMCNWTINASERYLSVIYDYLKEYLKTNKVIHVDETPVQVDQIKSETGKPAKTYMWVYCAAKLRGTHPIVLYDWKPGRGSEYPREFLNGFKGTMVTDGYDVYHAMQRSWVDLTVAGCWIHARRKFADIIKSVGEEAAKGTVACEAYQSITAIMHKDNQYDDLTKKQRQKMRNQELRKDVEAFFKWVKLKHTQVGGQTAIGQALGYCINQENYLKEFLDNGDIPMDNNVAERAIRPFTIGRKNWTTINSPNGAQASAIIYSIVETAKANNLRPYNYLELLLKEIPNHMEDTDRSFLEDLLPWNKNVQKTCHSLKKS
mgnify:FL=1